MQVAPEAGERRGAANGTRAFLPSRPADVGARLPAGDICDIRHATLQRSTVTYVSILILAVLCYHDSWIDSECTIVSMCSAAAQLREHALILALRLVRAQHVARMHLACTVNRRAHDKHGRRRAPEG